MQSTQDNLWIYSPDPRVENAVAEVRRRHPSLYPNGLERTKEFLEKLGDPHCRLPFTFHVAGTNGKGSALAFLQAMLEAAGLTVHKFISPHLVRFEERIVLQGKEISSARLLDLIAQGEKAAEGLEVSFFEFFTGLSFLAFAEEKADAVLLETGLGGLYDATNVVEGPALVSLLTRISHDHQRVLGDTLEQIATHKAGIIKPHIPVVIAPQPKEALAVFSKRATELKSPVIEIGKDVQVMETAAGWIYQSPRHQFHLPPPALLGRHQYINAATAIAALEQGPFRNILKADILERAMKAVTWQGRLQNISGGFFGGCLEAGSQLWLDGAHNDSGAEILLEQIKSWGRDLPLHLVTAMKKTKDAAAFYRPLLPHISSLSIIDVATGEQMMPPEDLKAEIIKLGFSNVQTSPSLQEVLLSLPSGTKRILVTGSLYLVGEVLKQNMLLSSGHKEKRHAAG